MECGSPSRKFGEQAALAWNHGAYCLTATIRTIILGLAFVCHKASEWLIKADEGFVKHVVEDNPNKGAENVRSVKPQHAAA